MELTIAILTVVTGLITALGVRLTNLSAAKSTPAKLAAVLSLARTVVAGVEKLGHDSGLSGEGKYDFAATAIGDFASTLSLALSPAEVSALIHAVLAEVDQFDAMQALQLDTAYGAAAA